jgi:four helix bundle protein
LSWNEGRKKAQGQGTRIESSKNNRMSKELEDRFHTYAKSVRDFCRKVKWDIINREYVKQVIRSSGSINANYTEASDDLGKADEKMKIKISRREVKETIHWLDLILTDNNPELESEKAVLINEGEQIRKILSAIINKLGG